MKAIIEKFSKNLFGLKYILRKPRNMTRAQSMIEFALLLPILIILLLIMVELGFVLNTYLSLLDATRQAARIYSDKQPFADPIPPATVPTDKLDFYSGASDLLIETLNSNSYQIQFDESAGSPDNVLVSAIGVDVNTSTNPDTITIIRHPDASQYWALNPDSVLAGYTSKYANDQDIKDIMQKGGSTAVSTGLLIVEVYYGYEGTLQVPGIRTFGTVIGFATEENPMVLYAASVMPLSAAKP